MQVILTMLCGILMGAFNFGFFLLGYYVRDKKPSDEGITVTNANKEFITEMMQWRNYNGGK